MSQRIPRPRRAANGASDAEVYAFDGFISYSHAADGRLAPALQEGIQRLAKPWYRRRQLHVFRDDTGLSVTPALWDSIQASMEQARWFVLMMSPTAAESEWVNREVEYWCTIRPSERILPILTAGDWAWDDAAGDFDWERSTAVPPSLARRFESEPRVLDLRWAHSDVQVNLRNGRFRDAVAQVAAPMHGVDKDALVGEDIRQHRRTLRLAWTASCLLILLVLLTSVTGLVAVDQRDQARNERDVADSRQLATRADLESVSRLDLSLPLSVEALSIRDTAEARGALLRSVEQTPELVGMAYGMGSISGLASSPDGRTLAAGDGDVVRLWKSGHPPRTVQVFHGHHGRVVSVAFSADGGSLVSVDDTGEVIVWDLASSDRRAAITTAPAQRVRQAQLSAHGERVAIVVDTSVTVWDIGTGVAVGSLQAEPDDELSSVAFSADGRVIALGSRLGTIRFVNESLKPIGPKIELAIGDYSQSIGVLAFSPDGTELASSGGGQGVVTVWEVSSGQSLGAARHAPGQTDQVTALAFASDGSILASGSAEGTIATWNLVSLTRGSELPLSKTLPGQGAVNALVFGGDSTSFLSASSAGVVAVWDTQQKMRLGRGIMGGGSDFVGSLSFHPDGNQLATASLKGVTYWRDVSGEPRGERLVSSASVNDVAFSPDGRTLAWANGDGTVVLWDLADHKARRKLVDRAGDEIRAVEFSPDGTTLASAGEDGRVVLWNTQTGRQNGPPLLGHDASVASVAFSPDSTTLASAGEDGRVVLWNTQTGRQNGPPLLGHDGSVASVAFSPDSTTLASAGEDGTVVLWNVTTRQPRRRLAGDPGEPVNAVTFSPDGQTLATGADKVNLWDVDTGSKLGSPLAGTRDFVDAVAFSPDGKTLAWGSYSIEPTNDLLVLWPATTEAWTNAACALVNRNLSGEEWNRYVAPAREYRPTCG